MQKVWNVIQGILVTGASISVMAWVANQYVSRPNLTQLVEQGTTEKAPLANLAKAATEPNHDNIVVIDIPLPPGRIRAITQNIVISGGKITSATATIEH